MGDWELLQAYAKQRSERAFAELVQRHLHWVYSAALRQVNDRPLAEDVTQAVFVLLARKADRLRAGTILTGWLFRTTRFVAKTALRAQRRRQRREEVASAMITADSPDAAETVWNQLAPHLDEAVAALSESDRSAILLRFYEQKSFREVGEQLGVTEDAVKKRVSRALDKLRAFLTRRGVALGAVGLAGILTEQTVQAAPAMLATGALQTALAGTTASLPHLVRETLDALRWAKLKLVTGITAVFVAGIVLTTNAILKREHNAPPPVVAAALRAAGSSMTLTQQTDMQIKTKRPVNKTASAGHVAESGLLRIRVVDPEGHPVSIKQAISLVYINGPNNRVRTRDVPVEQQLQDGSILIKGSARSKPGNQFELQLLPALGLPLTATGTWPEATNNLVVLTAESTPQMLDIDETAGPAGVQTNEVAGRVVDPQGNLVGGGSGDP